MPQQWNRLRFKMTAMTLSAVCAALLAMPALAMQAREITVALGYKTGQRFAVTQTRSSVYKAKTGEGDSAAASEIRQSTEEMFDLTIAEVDAKGRWTSYNRMYNKADRSAMDGDKPMETATPTYLGEIVHFRKTGRAWNVECLDGFLSDDDETALLAEFTWTDILPAGLTVGGKATPLEALDLAALLRIDAATFGLDATTASIRIAKSDDSSVVYELEAEVRGAMKADAAVSIRGSLHAEITMDTKLQVLTSTRYNGGVECQSTADATVPVNYSLTFTGDATLAPK